MRIYFSEPLADPPAALDGTAWSAIRSPSPRTGFLLAALLGVSLSMLLIGVFILDSILRPVPLSAEDMAAPTPWAILGLVFFTFVPLHEFVHLVFQPGGGLTPQSYVVVWPARLSVGVYFEGVLSRRRWLVMRTAPFVLLSGATALLLLAVPGLSFEAETALSALMVLNALGSGGDAAAVLLVLRQVPPSGRLRFRGGRVAWSGSASDTADAG